MLSVSSWVQSGIRTLPNRKENVTPTIDSKAIVPAEAGDWHLPLILRPSMPICEHTDKGPARAKFPVTW